MKKLAYLPLIAVLICLMILFAACKPAAVEPPAGKPPAGEAPAGEAPSGDAPAEDTSVGDPPPAEPSAFIAFDPADRSIFAHGLTAKGQAALDGLPGASVYQIDFTITKDYLQLNGHEVVYYFNNEDINLNEIYFQLFPNHAGGRTELANSTIDGAMVEPEFVDEDRAVRLPLAEPLSPGEMVQIEFDFTVDLPTEMAGNFGTFGYFDDVIVLDEFYPVIPVYDQDGWNYHVPSMGDLTYLDASFYLVQVTAPRKLVMVASGYEVDRAQEGKDQVVTYAAGPARDFYLAGSEKFSRFSRQVGETQINSYAFSKRKQGAEEVLDISERALKGFNARFGDYPYIEMDLASTPMQALGIEYPGLMGISLELYDLNAEVYGLPAGVILESTVAHEVGHQYFYNVVGNSQVKEPWLDEAVVQYITGLYYLDAYGQGAYNSYRGSWTDRWSRVDMEPIPVGMPSEDYDGLAYGAIVYGRGPLFIEALAEEMGQETFDTFLRSYYQSNLWGLGDEPEFRAMAEAECDCDLSGVFTEWGVGE